MSFVALGIGVCVLLGACQKPAVTGLAWVDEAGIRKALDEAMVLGNAAEKDFTAYVKHYYAENATVMPAHAPAITGHTAIIPYFEAFPPYEDMRFEVIEISGCGDSAYVRGTYSMNIMIPGQEASLRDVGKYVEIWKKQADGSWKVYLDCFNSDLPIPSLEMDPEK
jgi:ketosteroid isomerase-like protein